MRSGTKLNQFLRICLTYTSGREETYSLDVLDRSAKAVHLCQRMHF